MMGKIMGTLILILMFMNLGAPPSNSIVIFENESVNPFENLYKAICEVESSGNPLAIGDRHLKEWSYGICQVRRSRLTNYYRRTGIRYSTSDMFDPTKAKEVFMYYCMDYNPSQFMEISRSWNGGYDWERKKSTIQYWKRVKIYLDKSN